jgi:hypothetical protein
MRTIRRALAGGLLLAAGTLSCSTEPEPPPPPPARTYVITYAAVATGDAFFDYVSYDNGLGRRIDILVPPKTWSTQIQMNNGDTVELEAGGPATTGTLTISVTGDDGLGNEVTLSEQEVGNGTTMTYTLTIPRQQLP